MRTMKVFFKGWEFLIFTFHMFEHISKSFCKWSVREWLNFFTPLWGFVLRIINHIIKRTTACKKFTCFLDFQVNKTPAGNRLKNRASSNVNGFVTIYFMNFKKRKKEKRKYETVIGLCKRLGMLGVVQHSLGLVRQVVINCQHMTFWELINSLTLRTLW